MSFDRPVGAAADAKELEYIAALVQTDDVDKDGFVDASIDGKALLNILSAWNVALFPVCAFLNRLLQCHKTVQNLTRASVFPISHSHNYQIARDIKYHLKSRYGIEISEEQVRKIILNGLGGGEDEDDCLDLCEVMAALIIPLLRKITKEHEEADKLEQEQPLEDNEENLEAVFCDQ
eukprot:5283577-Ditylum_brightwellii.AAC.1